MKKFKLLLLVISLSFNVFGQIKTCVYGKYGIINKYTNNAVLTVYDVLRVTRNEDNSFSIKIHDPNLIKYPLYTLKVFLKGYDELNEKYIYVGEAIQEGGMAYGKCLINSFNKLDIYLENNGNPYNTDMVWDRKFSFGVYLKNIRLSETYDKSMYNTYIGDSFIEIFPVKKRTALDIKKEQEEKAKQETLRAQKKIKQVKKYGKLDILKIKEILSEVNIEEKIAQIKLETEEHYKTILKNEITSLSLEDVLTLKNKNISPENISIVGDFILRVDTNRNTEIIKKDVTCMLPDYKILTDDEDQIFNEKAIHLRYRNPNEYKINNNTYYNVNYDIFTNTHNIGKDFTVETKILGVNLKNGKFKYYINRNIVPEMVKNWCIKNIATDGLYFIHYIIIDGELVCRILNTNKKEKQYLKKYFKNYK